MKKTWLQSLLGRIMSYQAYKICSTLIVYTEAS